jgi:hypothetical protein
MRKTSAWTAVVAAGLFALGPGLASASQMALATTDAHNAADPHEFESRAKSLFAFPKRYDEAIKLFLKAADTREVGDPVRVQDMVLASRLAFYRQDRDRSLAYMLRAADEAAATGDVITAAHSYMDAAFIAKQVGNAETVVKLVKKAELLAYSPLIGDKDREGILVRIRST